MTGILYHAADPAHSHAQPLSLYRLAGADARQSHVRQKLLRSGCRCALVELGTTNDLSSAFGASAGDAAAAPAEGEAAAAAEPAWVFIPISEHLKAKEVNAATRVGDFTAAVQLKDSWKNSVLMGIDRVDFPKVADRRRDFAPASLGALMNSLAIANDGILMERKVMAENGLRVGDSIPVRISTSDGRAEVLMKIVGEIDYFPRLLVFGSGRGQTLTRGQP